MPTAYCSSKLLADQKAAAEQAKEAERQHGAAQAAATLTIEEMGAKLVRAKNAAGDTAQDVEARTPPNAPRRTRLPRSPPSKPGSDGTVLVEELRVN
ncbi:MAG: hypothetical protein M1826_001658 [Phylliscum demangeonii]|nr:MAG: hypothetical protein M1826_001658 [Phylliscum demangeonii]